MLAQAFPTRHTYVCLFCPYPIFFCRLNTKISLGDNIFSLPRQKPIFALHFDHILNRRGVYFRAIFASVSSALERPLGPRLPASTPRAKSPEAKCRRHGISPPFWAMPSGGSRRLFLRIYSWKWARESRRTLGQSHPHVPPCYMLHAIRV